MSEPADLHDLDLAALGAGLAARRFSAEELCRHQLARIDTLQPCLNALITVTAEQALQGARAADARRAAGTTRGLLDGIPLLHKDVFCTEGVLTSCGSRMLANFTAPYDATVVRRCDEAGLVMLGKTNMDEFAMGSSCEHSYFGPTRNPWDTDRVPGGSSGGSAAAVAARLAPLATATDTGGSIRQPAAFCGVSGIKPTYGRVSRYGMVAFASSLDQGGLMAASAADLALGMDVIAGFDPLDSTSAQQPVAGHADALHAGVAGLRVGLVAEHFDAALDSDIGSAVQAAAAQLQTLGAELVEVSLAETALSVPTYYVIALAECSSNLSRYDGVRFGHRSSHSGDLTSMYEHSRAEGFGAEVKRRIMLGTYALSAGYYEAYYHKAQQLRRLVSEDFASAFARVDVLLAPVTPALPFAIGAHIDDPVAMYLGDVYTCGVNLAGLPAVALPVGTASGLPIGAQLIGPHFSEARLLATAHAYQQASDWHRQRPALASRPAP